MSFDDRPKTLEKLWDRLVSDVLVSWEEVVETPEDDYFLGIFDGQMAALAEVAFYMGRMEEYGRLCQKTEGISWLGGRFE